MEEEVIMLEGKEKVLIWMLNIKARIHTQKSKSDSCTVLCTASLRELVLLIKRQAFLT